ncbi:hypothetical protein LTR78_005747 [Recurvomyces mirabilis]|uniref:Transmembrane protein n=1 Tax=Recurvomyces mirabilis TaxID=574656 RepID=A0AAE0WM86_9PEZI|nr:hypothetical protein LTR78_005747 [Recurvomyces mirabilis]KAK5154126.1 hypothetical protein LTS14_006811 [Recurvomyces mirabilis]
MSSATPPSPPSYCETSGPAQYARHIEQSPPSSRSKPTCTDDKGQPSIHGPVIRDFAYDHHGQSTRSQRRPSKLTTIKLGPGIYTRTCLDYAELKIQDLGPSPGLYRHLPGFPIHVSGTVRTSESRGTQLARTHQSHHSQQDGHTCHDRQERRQRRQTLREYRTAIHLAIAAEIMLVIVAGGLVVIHASAIADAATSRAHHALLVLRQCVPNTSSIAWTDWSAGTLVLAGFAAGVAGFSMVGVAVLILFSWVGGSGVEAAVLSTVTSELTTSVTSTSTMLPASATMATIPGVYNITLLPNVTLSGPYQADISAGSCYYPNCVYDTVNSAGSIVLPESLLRLFVYTSTFLVVIWAVCKAAFAVQAMMNEQVQRVEQVAQIKQAKQIEKFEQASLPPPELDMEADEVFEYETGMNKETIFPLRTSESNDAARLSKRQKRTPSAIGTSRSRSDGRVCTLKKRKVVVPRRTLDVDERVYFMHYPPRAVEQDFRSSL